MKDISVGGQCICYGHALECQKQSDSDVSKYLCPLPYQGQPRLLRQAEVLQHFANHREKLVKFLDFQYVLDILTSSLAQSREKSVNTGSQFPTLLCLG